MEPTQLSLVEPEQSRSGYVGDLPDELVYRPGVLSAELESSLITAIDAQPWMTSLSRRVQHYGWRYDYRARRVDPDAFLGPLPDFLAPLVSLVEDEVGITPDQAIVNEYTPGQGIAPHVDCEPCFGPEVAMVALGSDIQMDFRHRSADRTGFLRFARGSLLVLSGPARFEWTHAIAKRKSDPRFGIRRGRRISVTFRTIVVSR